MPKLFFSPPMANEKNVDCERRIITWRVQSDTILFQHIVRNENINSLRHTQMVKW